MAKPFIYAKGPHEGMKNILDLDTTERETFTEICNIY